MNNFSQKYDLNKQYLLKLLIEKSYKKGNFTLSSGKQSAHYLNCKPVSLNGTGLQLISNLFLELMNPSSKAVAGLTLGADPLVSGVIVTAASKGLLLDALIIRKEIKEYGMNGQLISNIVLAKPIAEKLYKFPPPRFGNRLDEISIILEDIYQKDHKIPFDVFIPKTDHDLMVLTNNDSLLVQLQDITNLEVKFKIIGQEGNLTMPINRVKNIMSKYGERIYP